MILSPRCTHSSSPRSTPLNGLSELLLKASPLILIACGLAVGFRANVWNIGAEGQLIMGAVAATGVALFYPDPESALLLPLMLVAGIAAGMAWAAIPAFLRARMNTNEILVTLMLDLCRDAVPVVAGAWPVARSGRLQLSADRAAAGGRHVPAVRLCLPRQLVGLHHRPCRRRACGSSPIAASSATRWRSAGRRRSPPAMPASREPRADLDRAAAGGACAGIAGMTEVGRAARPAVAADLARLRLCGHHRRLHRPAECARHRARRAADVAALPRRRNRPGRSSACPSPSTGVFQGILLFFLLAADFFIFYRFRAGRTGIR